ncbi:uncharacterized protein LOC118189939 isoform X3 [Stegodyphus dumicola]|uniref:uncharacterized protein LOC118189939 isoform X3 n=1 Tax=Stegodyphus dumicola TaxID=202533 RepID=UPI0015A9C95C|nr:uncharacterized protein LOC118189939 isoform X3 [Stegodyphus dumicola]
MPFLKKDLLTILKNNIFKDYVSFLKRRLNKCALVEEVENFLRKFLKVCHILPRSLEISDEDVEIYEFMAELLEFCYNVDVQDSHIVISLLKITIDWYTKAIADTRHVRQPVYKQGFLRYILNHSMKARFDLSSFCSKHPAALWDYSRSFSVLNAVAFGNVQRTLTLLQHGVEVFTAGDLEKSGHGFANIPQVIPPRHLLILQMMRMMRSINMFILNAVRSADFGLYSATQDQKRSFELVWRAIPDPHIKYKEIAVDILKEYCFLERHYVTNPMRYEKNWKYLLMYENCFKDVATSPKEPRTLKHLCRCTIRKSLKDAWKLPVGIFQLRLPKILQDYLNLEFD